MVSQVFSSLVDGLAEAMLAWRNAIHRPQRFELRSDRRPFALRSLRPSGPSVLASIELNADGTVGSLPADLPARLRGSRVEIVVPAGAVMEKLLEPLPSESRPYIRQVVQHKIETLFPWPAEDTLFDVEVADRSDKRLDVTVRATSSRGVAEPLAAATACGAGEVVIVRDGEAVRAQTRAIPAFVGQDKQVRMKRARAVASYAIAVPAIFAVVAFGLMAFVRANLESDIADLDQAIAQRQGIIQRAAAQKATASNLEAKKQQSVIAVLVLEELSRVLPTDTYLTALTMDAEKVQFSGVSTNAADLIPLLEQTGRFKNANFYAPTTRQANGMDRFSIEAAIAPGDYRAGDSHER